KGNNGGTAEELMRWLKPSQRTNLRRTLNQMNHDKDFIVNISQKYKITRKGILEVQKRKLLEL
ncbi:MAG TPA: hypothetical protein VJ184_11335, partial [Chryseolinea sp.]|nr:hypothetical protein [Chryseolinea sp.]